MDPFIGGALISGGASLLGGLLGRTQTVSAGKNAYSHVKGIMRASNEFGFNPLTLLGAVSPMGATQSSNNYLGSAVAEAGMMLGDAYAKMQTARTQAKLNVIERQNRDLSRKLTDATIRPKIAGVYDQRGAGFGTAVNPTPSAAAALRPLLQTTPVDGRREVDNKKISSTGGVMVVDNPHLPGPLYFPTSDGDEMMGADEAIVAGAFGVPQLAFRYGDTMTLGGGRESRPSISRADALEMRDARRDAKKWRYQPRLRFDPNHRDGYYTAPFQ